MNTTIFEDIRHFNKQGMEYWKARELYKLLKYTEFGKFSRTIERAKEACKNSQQVVFDHFAGVSEMIISRKRLKKGAHTVTQGAGLGNS